MYSHFELLLPTHWFKPKVWPAAKATAAALQNRHQYHLHTAERERQTCIHMCNDVEMKHLQLFCKFEEQVVTAAGL
jgi:hypothetical protein